MDFAISRDEERFPTASTASAILRLPPYSVLLPRSRGRAHDVLGVPR